MEEDALCEDELEERLYAEIYYAGDSHDCTKPNLSTVAFVPPQQNISKQPPINRTDSSVILKNLKNTTSNEILTNQINQPEQEQKDHSLENSVFQSPISKTAERFIHILNSSGKRNIVEIVTSDEDEVVEVTVPPKPTITIDSSDEDELSVLSIQQTKCLSDNRSHQQREFSSHEESNKHKSVTKQYNERDVSASPVPSVVSSVSDEFIRSDCIALKISSKKPENASFDFTLHGADLGGLSPTSIRKKKKKRSKDKNNDSHKTSEPQNISKGKVILPDKPHCFATPKNTTHKIKDNATSYKITECHQMDTNRIKAKNSKNYIASQQGIPNADVYESDSNQSLNAEQVEHKDQDTGYVQILSNNVNESVPIDVSSKDVENLLKTNSEVQHVETPSKYIDLTADTDQLVLSSDEDNIVFGNVSGLDNTENITEDVTTISVPTTDIVGSKKIPPILNEKLDFDHMKRLQSTSKRRCYSVTALRDEMNKFYNESWGGESFDHREIQKFMTVDKSMWAIDSKDRMPTPLKRKIICNYCNRIGHRDDTCRAKPPICHMCGILGHYETRCPMKICVHCGSPNFIYSTRCRNCADWVRLVCSECGQSGHPVSHCPDLWRRYHNTIENDGLLYENRQIKKHYQLFCSGCSRRGHLVHSCRLSVPFSGLPINSPYVAYYRPVYPSSSVSTKDTNNRNINFTKKNAMYENIQKNNQQYSAPNMQNSNKRFSKSPIPNEQLRNKRRPSESIIETSPQVVTPQNTFTCSDVGQHNASTITELSDDMTTRNIVTKEASDTGRVSIGCSDELVLQDNEVSDTTDVVTTVRVYVLKEIIDKLGTENGKEWLSNATQKHNVTVEISNSVPYITVKGKVGSHELFQSECKEWANGINSSNTSQDDAAFSDLINNREQVTVMNIPKNKNNVLRMLTKAFANLKKDLGDPKSLYKDLIYLQNQRLNLLKQKNISLKKLFNNRDNINQVLKCLNTVLLGQAGLGDGPEHLKELMSIQEKLSKNKQRTLTNKLREEIGQHYHCIFTATARNDYSELVKKYYNKRKTYNKQETMIHDKNDKTNKQVDNKECDIMASKPHLEMIKKKLMFYHNRVVRANPTDAILKKTRSQLVRRLHTHISALDAKQQTSSRALKKMKKTQAQARVFLLNL